MVKALRDQLDGLPSHLSVSYDKGIRGLRAILPHYNNVYMPCFLRPSEGKTHFTIEEASLNKAVATNRYVVEIMYSRVKAWKILAGEIPHERFHLLDSAWFWALGFQNMFRAVLKQPACVDFQ